MTFFADYEDKASVADTIDSYVVVVTNDTTSDDTTSENGTIRPSGDRKLSFEMIDSLMIERGS